MQTIINDEAQLIAAVAAGDNAAFGELVERYQARVFRTAMSILHNQQDAEDATQESFAKAFMALPTFEGASRFSTWLLRIAINESLMLLRRRRPERHVWLDQPVESDESAMVGEVVDWNENPEEQYSRGQLRQILDEGLAALKPDMRVVVLMRDVEGLSTEEVAESLGLSLPAVKSRLLRGRLQLRRHLNRYFRRAHKGADTKMDSSFWQAMLRPAPALASVAFARSES